MRSILIASPPPQQFFSGLLFGLVIVVGIIAIFLRRKPDLKWRGLLLLCFLTLVLGPLAGAGLAGLGMLFGDVHPLDRWWLVFSLTTVGLVASLLAAPLIGIIGTIRILGRSCAGQHHNGGDADPSPGG
jgi:ABC-type polysaccharide/polyol phosphate export permease